MKTFAIALAAAVAASASAFQAGECPNNPTQYDCVPGYELFWLGFNVVSGGTKSIINGTIKTLEPIFAAPTFSKGKTFQLVNDSPNPPPVWAVPDALFADDGNAYMKASSEATVVETFSAYQSYSASSFSFSASISVPCPSAAPTTAPTAVEQEPVEDAELGSMPAPPTPAPAPTGGCMGMSAAFSHQSAKFEEELSAGQNVSGISDVEYGFYDMHSLTPVFVAPLDPGYEAFVSNLPTSLSTKTSVMMYNMFVEYYGTHVIGPEGITMGAYAHVASFLSKKFYAKQSHSWVMNEFSLAFSMDSINLAPSFWSNHSHGNASSEFLSNSATYTFVKGGDPAAYTNTTQGQANWLATTRESPAWIGVSLTDLSDTILFKHPQVASNLNTVIAYYVKHNKPYPEPTTDEEVLEAVAELDEYWTPLKTPHSMGLRGARKPTCPGSDAHGTCVAPGKRICRPCYTGVDCSTSLCPAAM